MYFNLILALRAVAALAVCFFHFTCGNTAYLPAESWIKAVGELGRYGVDIFFVVSGFVIPYSLSKKNYVWQACFLFLRKRFVRIEVPYLASLLLALFLFWIVGFYKKETFAIDWTAFWAHFLYLNSLLALPWLVPVYWTLAIEFQYYIWIALLFPLLNSPTLAKRYSVWVLWIALSWLIPQDVWVFHYVGLFGLGILLCQYQLKQIRAGEFVLSMAVLINLVVYQLGILPAIAGSLASLVIWYEIQQAKTVKIHSFLAFVGKVSYSLYLTHVLIAGRFIGFVERKTGFLYFRLLAIPVAMLLAIGIAYIFYKLIEERSKGK